MTYKVSENLTIDRWVVARGVPPNDGYRWTNDSDSALCVPRIRMGTWIPVPYDGGAGYLLLLLPHVQSSRLLRKIWSPTHSFPRTSCWCFRWLVFLLFFFLFLSTSFCSILSRPTLHCSSVIFLACRAFSPFLIILFVDFFTINF